MPAADDRTVQRHDAAALTGWIAAAFGACGVPGDDAQQAARVLVRTSLRGIDTHGVSRVAAYLERLRTGEVNPRPVPRFELRHGLLHVEADGGLGQGVAARAVRHAVELARSSALVAGVIRGSGHLAALGLFALEAAEQGMVALLCQRTPPVIALPGARARAIGNNPIAFALPVADGAPLVFDMASSVTSYGRIAQALRDRAASVPSGWAIGPDGLPTTDPARVLALLPVGGHKGIGLAMLVECLAGTLSGLDRQDGAATAATGSAGNAGAFLIVINPDLVVGRAAFDASVRGWLGTYLQASGPEGRYPGQRQAESERHRSAHGIPVPDSVRAELCRAGDAIGVPFDLRPIGPQHGV